MKSFVVALLVLVPAVATAQPGAPADPEFLAKLLRAGQIAAEQGKCDTVEEIGHKVGELDAVYKARIYLTDAIIATCMQGIDRRQRPPSSMDPAITEALPAAPERARDPYRREWEKSESTATALSLGGTLASYALVYAGTQADGDTGDAMGTIGAIGTMIAPSFGHWYTGKFATTGLGMRGAALGLGLTAMLWSFSECPLFGDHCDRSIGPGALAVGAAGLWVAGTISDISTAADRVREYNRSGGDLAIVPMVHEGGGSVTLSGRF